MNEDIVPGLLANIEDDFKKSFQSDDTLKTLYGKVQDGTATQADGEKFSHELGRLTAEVFHRNVTPEILPDGTMYYNIANRIITPILGNNHDIVCEVMKQVIERLNHDAGLGIKFQEPELEFRRVHDLVWKASLDKYEKLRKMVETGLDTFTRSVADDCVRTNAEFQYEAGLSPRIERDTDGDCCSWCSDMAGSYEYARAPKEVFARHANCGCTVEFLPGDGRRQNVHTKDWTSETESAMMKAEGFTDEEHTSDLIRLFERNEAEDRNRQIHYGEKSVFVSDKHVYPAREVLTARYKTNNIYVDERLSLSLDQIRMINWQVKAAKQVMGIEGSCNIPFVIAQMDSKRLASYNPVSDVIFLNSDLSNRDLVLKNQSGFACADDPRSTVVHELFHWLLAEEYRNQYGSIADITLYNNYQRENCEKKLHEVGIVTEDDARAISSYAVLMQIKKNDYEEVYVEWKTKNLLEDK